VDVVHLALLQHPRGDLVAVLLRQETIASDPPAENVKQGQAFLIFRQTTNELFAQDYEECPLKRWKHHRTPQLRERLRKGVGRHEACAIEE